MSVLLILHNALLEQKSDATYFKAAIRVYRRLKSNMLTGRLLMLSALSVK